MFGMGTGVSSSLSPPDFLGTYRTFKTEYSLVTTSMSSILDAFSFLGQALDLLVSVRLTHYCASTPDLSTT